jgi:hypothetical protein
VLAILLVLVMVCAVVSGLRQPPPNEHTRWYRVPTYKRQKRRSERWMIVRVDEGETPPFSGVLVGRGEKP